MKMERFFFFFPLPFSQGINSATPILLCPLLPGKFLLILQYPGQISPLDYAFHSSKTELVTRLPSESILSLLLQVMPCCDCLPEEPTHRP